MQIEKVEIIKLCNMSHPDFGTFARFLDGLNKGEKFIEIPPKVEMLRREDSKLSSDEIGTHTLTEEELNSFK